MQKDPMSLYVHENFDELLAAFGGGQSDGSWLVQAADGTLESVNRERGRARRGRGSDDYRVRISRRDAERQMIHILRAAFRITFGYMTFNN